MNSIYSIFNEPLTFNCFYNAIYASICFKCGQYSILVRYQCVCKCKKNIHVLKLQVWIQDYLGFEPTTFQLAAVISNYYLKNLLNKAVGPWWWSVVLISLFLQGINTIISFLVLLVCYLSVTVALLRLMKMKDPSSGKASRKSQEHSQKFTI